MCSLFMVTSYFSDISDQQQISKKKKKSLIKLPISSFIWLVFIFTSFNRLFVQLSVQEIPRWWVLTGRKSSALGSE